MQQMQEQIRQINENKMRMQEEIDAAKSNLSGSTGEDDEEEDGEWI
jgi:hypothetical protein